MYSKYRGVAYRQSLRHTAAENIAVTPGADGYPGEIHHVVLGIGSVRLACYKVFAELWVDGETIDCLQNGAGGFEGYAWEIDGDDNVVKVRFVEPDGTVWEATSGLLEEVGE